jgi:hypothetical protein
MKHYEPRDGIDPKTNLLNAPPNYYEGVEVDESVESFDETDTILSLAARPQGVNLIDLIKQRGENVCKEVQELEDSGLLYIEDDGTIRSNRGY